MSKKQSNKAEEIAHTKITVNPDDNGRYIIELYGKKFDVTEVDTLKAFGKEYKLSKSKTKLSTLPTEAQPDDDLGETLVTKDTDEEARP